MKILGAFGNKSASNNMKEDKPTYREQFVSPEMSMLSNFLTKPKNTGKLQNFKIINRLVGICVCVMYSFIFVNFYFDL